MTEADDLKTAIDNLQLSIQNEIQQLSDALGTATQLSDLKAAVSASVTRLQGLDTQLKADDPTP